VDKSRYQKMAQTFGLTAHEQLVCGCHVHVEISSDQEGVAALDRIGPWLPTLLALSANSPFWQGHDSGYHGVLRRASLPALPHPGDPHRGRLPAR
jgi:carboxylate-amine ligase